MSLPIHCTLACDVIWKQRNIVRFLFSCSSSLYSTIRRVSTREGPQKHIRTHLACWRIHWSTTARYDSPTWRVESLAGIICRICQMKARPQNSPPYTGREKAHFTLRCICAHAMCVVLFLRAILIHRARQRPTGIVYERSTAWKHVTKPLANTGRVGLFYSYPITSCSSKSFVLVHLVTFIENR